ncbi:MAG: YdcF family protein [Rhodospirillales bacterium]|nr:YdcF family protein [Rhodospirillales bacterium]
MAAENTEYFIIFGAAVLPDGMPSGTLRRRVMGAVDAAAGNPGAIFIPSGGVGRHGHVESEIMTKLILESGIPGDRIIEDSEATDTFDTVVNTARIMRARSKDISVVVCSSRYHNPRCAMLFRLLGFSTRIPPMPADKAHLGLKKWLFFWLREIPAYIWDGYLMLIRKKSLNII